MDMEGGSLVSNELTQLLLGLRVEVPHGVHVDPGFLQHPDALVVVEAQRRLQVLQASTQRLINRNSESEIDPV